MPVLVDGPLCRADTSELKHVQGKDVSDGTQSISSKKPPTYPPALALFKSLLGTTAPTYPEVTDLSL